MDEEIEMGMEKSSSPSNLWTYGRSISLFC